MPPFSFVVLLFVWVQMIGRSMELWSQSGSWLGGYWPIHESWFVWVALAALGAGLVRGLTGFGGAMIIVPVISLFLGPVVAVPVLNVIDTITSLPMLPPAMRRCHWREVIPLFIGAVLLLPLGVYLLTYVNPDLLRHVMAVIILIMAVIMALGLRYHGEPTRIVSLVVGAASGLMTGAVGLSGPPVALFWLGGKANAMTTRANIIAYFGLMSVAVIAVMAWHGLFTVPVLRLSLILMPLYALGVIIGARGFRYASEGFFRLFVLLLIAGVAVFSLVR
jgi:uncharacterized membrane protein YfcA